MPGEARPARQVDRAAPRLSPAGIAMRYVRRLWAGELPLSRVFWTDMLAVGTLLNVVALLAALPLFVEGPTAVALAVFLSPLPYNIMLVVGVWRSAEREGSRWTWPAQAIAVAWLILVLVV